ncbi:nucleotidyl transferase AbiEii/AbiGii toxin family protein [Candidatus Woesebacteria bacterium]|nr:nucleotidyl transferase AbiEii/AbiGii toxin family protein [Candidatus Woesebacteria bacterium]
MEPQGLTTQQQLILNCISDSSIAHIFTFSGGTALSSMFLHHRFSEDLDFFSLEEFDPRMLHDFISSLKDTLQYSHFDYRSSFNRHLFFLHFKNREILKLEFDYYPFPPIQKGPKYKNIQVDSLIDIAANKLHIMSVKPRSRDYIDLFFIYNVHHYNLKELYYQTKQKFDTHIDPVQLGVNLLLFDPSDMSMVHAPPPEKDIRSFFKTKVKEIESLILTE